MRSQSGTRNRVVLVLLGVLALAAAGWLAAAAYDLASGVSALGAVVPDGSSTPTSLLEGAGWAIWVGIALSVVAVLGGIGLLVAQVPTAPRHTLLRLYGADGSLLATLEPQVLERALAERVEAVQGVEGASVRVTGSAASAEVMAEVTVSESAEISWTIAQARTRLFEDLSLTLGSEPRAVDVLVSLRTPKSSARSDRVAVGSDPAGGDEK